MDFESSGSHQTFLQNSTEVSLDGSLNSLDDAGFSQLISVVKISPSAVEKEFAL
jgi:hypothetical protein